VAALSLLTTTQSRADYIREENGTLTTDLPGVTIKPTTPTLGGSEAWSVSYDLGIWGTVSIPDHLADEPGTVNLLSPVTVDTFLWESDVPSSQTAFPSGTTETWTSKPLGDVQVSFEDISDAPSGVPDGGSAVTMLGGAIVCCAGLRKRFVR
jgi:hypothetical protein